MNLFIWDFHGVLEKDNEFSVHEICNLVLKELDIKRDVSFKEVLELYGKSWGTYFRSLSPNSDHDEINLMIKRARELSEKVCSKYMKPRDNAHHVLKEIKKRGDKNIVLSISRHYRLLDFIDIVGISDLIDDAIGISDGVEVGNIDVSEHKRDRILEIVEKLGPNRCVMIGDKESDVSAGKAAGVYTILFSPDRNHANSKADLVVDNLKEVLKVYGGV